MYVHDVSTYLGETNFACLGSVSAESPSVPSPPHHGPYLTNLDQLLL